MNHIPRFIPSITIKELLLSILAEKKSKEDELKKFSNEFAEFIGVAHAIPTPSGRIALAGLLEALSLPQGGEVIIPALTFHAMPLFFKEYGLKPRFVDINPKTYCIDEKKIERAITPSTVAILPVHLYGQMCDMNYIMKIAQKYNLIVIEDCAQACGADILNQKAGSFGIGAIFSFHPHKNFCCLESGMVVTHSKDLAQKIKFYMQQFKPVDRLSLLKNILYIINMRFITRPLMWNFLIGPILNLCSFFNFDPIEFLTNENPSLSKKKHTANIMMPGQLHGYIGSQQLKKLNCLNRQRILYGNELCKRISQIEKITIPKESLKNENIFSSFVIQVTHKNKFRSALRKKGIDTHGGNMFVGPQIPGMDKDESMPNAERVIKEMLHIPLYPEMKKETIIQISDAIHKVFEHEPL